MTIRPAKPCLLVAVIALAGAVVSDGVFAAVPAGPPECGGAAPLAFSNGALVAVVDNTVSTSTIGVFGAGPYLWDVDVVTNLVHSFNAQLTVTLTSPSGTIVTLTSKNGGSNANVFNGTVWDDQANPSGQIPYTSNAGLVTDQTYVNGVAASPLAPEEALGAFTGEDPNGTWTLRISDDAAGNTGVLNGWSLSIAALPRPPSVLARLTLENTTPAPILDNATVTSPIDVPSGIGTRICELTLDTAITHASSGDLDITLTSPAGTVVTLTTDNGGANANVFNGTRFDDRADPGGQVPYVTNNGLVTDQAYVDGVTATPLVPEEALGAFLGESPAGTWTLAIGDDAAGGTGTLNSWTLHLTTCSCAESFAAAPLRVDEHGGGGPFSNLNGVLEVGESAQVEPSWTNAAGTPFTLVTYASNFGGPAGPAYSFVDAGASYGTVAPLSTSNCYDATGDCYRVEITGARPAAHWDAGFDEITAPIALQTPEPYYSTWTLHVGESFADVPTSNPFYRFIETIFHAGVTGGGSCGGYCPQYASQRKQMAVFLLKAKDGANYVPPPATGIFDDVPPSDPFAPWIEELYHRGVAAGCGPGPRYCPAIGVSRQQMAVFLLKMLLGSAYTPPPAAGIFGDVPASGLFAPWIEDLYNRSIAAGCGNGNFCPTTSNTRAQMAVFLTKTFGLQLYGP
ncbi:MAG: proprotein convertase P-domain-containing protein [Thermoanaerobaculia bacterium]